MLARVSITVLLILTAVTTYTQTHNTIIYQSKAAHFLKNADGTKPATRQPRSIKRASFWGQIV